jgi:hypothetical protein
MRKKILYFIIGPIILLSCTEKVADKKNVNVNEDQPFEMGFGKVDISGKDAFILDPLHVKAIVFRQGKEQVALVECDLSIVDDSISIPARKEASAKTGIPYENICVAATHTHMDAPHENAIPAIVEAISSAQSGLREVTIKSGIGTEFTVAFNRRYFMKDGSVVFNPMFLNPDIVRPAGPIDPEVGFVLFHDVENNAPVGSMTNYALHLDIVKEYGARYQDDGEGAENSVSADYPYWLEKNLKQHFGDDFNSIFFTGCCGNINHWDFSKPGPQSGHKTKSKQVGDSLYLAINRILSELKNEKPALASMSSVLQVPLHQYTEEDLEWARNMQNEELSSKSEEPSVRKLFLDRILVDRILWLERMKELGVEHFLPLEVQVFRMSDRTAVVALPGEMFVEHGMTIKNFSPFENTIIVELANKTINYVPTKKAYLQGGYEVVNSRVAPGGGEMLVEAAIDMLKSLKVIPILAESNEK